MLVIRPRHMAAFAKSQRAGFAMKIVIHLRHFHPRPVRHITDEALLEQVLLAIQHALSVKLTWESSLLDFAVKTFTVGAQFYSDPTIQRKLESRPGTADEQFEHLLLHTEPSVWDDVRRRCG